MHPNATKTHICGSWLLIDKKYIQIVKPKRYFRSKIHLNSFVSAMNICSVYSAKTKIET
jgi:hypothetical protein